jgi:pimeloyl-ACP methyl ester carboxylesterase
MIGSSSRFLAAVALVGSFPALSAAAEVQESRCVDRLTPEAAAKVGGPRLPELRYECIALAGGRSLWVGEAGNLDGAPVLLVHGLGNNAHRDWRNAIPALVATYRVIAIDLPGFGASEALTEGLSFDGLAATLDEVLRVRQVERAHVVGHSLGGALGLHFAWRYPQRVERLVLVDVAGILQRSVYARALMQGSVAATSGNPLLSALKRPLNALGRHLLRKVENTVDFGAWLERNPRALESLAGDRSQMASAISMVEQNFAPAIRSAQVPVTLIWGRDDPVAPLRTAKLLAARLPNAHLHVLDGVGHVPMVEAPGRFAELMLAGLGASFGQPAPALPSTEQQGAVVCKQKARVLYSGRFTSLRLANCDRVRIENAEFGYLQIDKSNAELYNVKVINPKTALLVRSSTITGTAIDVNGEIGIRADDSVIDFAGVSVKASGRALDLSSSATIYFSVSDLQSPGLASDAHDIWTRATVEAKQQ